MIDYNKLITDIFYLKLDSIELFIFIIFALLLSITIDVVFGELPTRIHPVVVMGSLINFFKNKFIKIKNRLSGLLLAVSVGICLSILLYVLYFVCAINIYLLFVLFTVLLSSTFSIKLLLKTAIDVKKDLDESIEKARRSVSYLVSRNTDELTESFIVSAVIESLTENITDSYVAPMFYFTIFAILILINPFFNELYFLLLVPMLYRMFNTLDAMVGYKTEELKDIGYFSAKIDDVLNYIPSRISGLYIVLSAFLIKQDWKNSFKIMKRDARKCSSPNSGFTMATTAGALNIQLIKKDTYILGDATKTIEKEDITKAVNLSKLTIILFTLTILILLILVHVIL